ncbi:MAG: RICIN domain-containing protein [Parahaliea sp.]
MKLRHAIPAFLALCATGASAIDLNTDALKKMQKEGHKIVAQEAQQEIPYVPVRLASGKCLQVAGDASKTGTNVVNQACNNSLATQQWRLQANGQLASKGGTCAAVASQPQKPNMNVVVKTCSADKDQQWKLDASGRVVNGFGHCLQGNGGGNVIAAACGNSALQQWSGLPAYGLPPIK